MKKLLFAILCLFSAVLKGQVEPSVTYEPATGNYICEYMGEDGLVQVVYEPTNKIIPQVDARVVFISDSNYFSYQYSVGNSALSIQRLQDFDLEIFSSIFKILNPDNYWESGDYSFVPVFGWFNSKGSSGLGHPLNGIAPDSSVTGFSFSSFGYPTILNAYFRGKPEKLLSFPDEPPGKISDLLRPLRKFPYDRVIKKTIGPKDLPSPFIPSEFLDTLINYTTKSFELGWITDQTTRDKYLNYFNTAKTALENSDTNTAFNQLLIVLAEVDVDSSTTLSSEAYALLKFNSEYLE